MSQSRCKICGKLLVDFIGPLASPTALLLDYPGTDDIIRGRLMSSLYDTASLEFARHGIQLGQWRIISLWQHAKDEKNCSVDAHFKRAMGEMKERSTVLVASTELPRMITNRKSPMYGLKLESSMLPSNVLFFCIPPLYTLTHGSLGEFRLAISKFRGD